jgi:hypothetical protein
MSSSDFQKVLVKDDRISNITDSIKYAVVKGGQSITSAQFNAISQSTSSHTYNIQVPSQETIIDRRVMWKSTVQFQVQVVNKVNTYDVASASDISILGYGGPNATTISVPVSANANPVNSSLCPFPLHSLCSVITSTINNTSVSINMQDVLPFMLRFYDKKELHKYNSTTPCQYDVEGNYLNSYSTQYNSLAGFQDSKDDYIPRGSWKLDSATNGVAGPYPATVAIGTTVTYTLTFTVSEPLLLSPWCFNNPSCNNGGIYGVQNLNFVMNIGSAKRLWRTTMKRNDPALVGSGVYLVGDPTLVSFSNSELQFQFLTPHPSDLLPARNVSPYYELPRYITTNASAFNAGATNVEFSSQSLQLNQIPDKLILGLRKTLSNQNSNDCDCWFPISRVNLQFNNQAGLLSSAVVQDIYRMSKDAGYNGSFYEFNGIANQGGSLSGAGPTYTGAGSSLLSGSVVILDFATAIQLPEDFYSCGSLGNFNLQVKLTASNLTAESFAANQLELVVITMNSGVFVSERGTSQVFTGILTKQDVLDASSQKSVSKGDVSRMVGGGFFDSLKSFISPIVSTLAPVAKMALSSVPDPRAQMASKVLGSLGAGQSGGGPSGGRRKMSDMRLE